LIADDGTDSIEDLLPNKSSFKYIKLASKKKQLAIKEIFYAMRPKVIY